jgi:magnesium transporter
MGKLDERELGAPVTSFMRSDYTVLHPTQRIEQALASLRSQSVAEKIIYFYVVDDSGKLLGVVPTRRLLMSEPQQTIAGIMVDRVISIPASMTVLDACEFFVMYRLLAFPVVDSEGKLLGVVDAAVFTDEVFDISEREASQNVFQMIGVKIARGRRAAPWSAFRDRFPWLLCNICGGIACAFIAGRYEHLLDQQILLAMFIPVVLTLAEAVSMQSMTLTLQALRDRIDWRLLIRSLLLELMIATFLGIACGTIVGLVAMAWKHHGFVAFAIGVSICLAVLTACLLGVLLPAAIRAARGDPRIASGPLVLAISDIATLLFYFNLCGMMLR